LRSSEEDGDDMAGPPVSEKIQVLARHLADAWAQFAVYQGSWAAREQKVTDRRVPLGGDTTVAGRAGEGTADGGPREGDRESGPKT
jgi:hypothetical protein